MCQTLSFKNMVHFVCLYSTTFLLSIRNLSSVSCCNICKADCPFKFISISFRHLITWSLILFMFDCVFKWLCSNLMYTTSTPLGSFHVYVHIGTLEPLLFGVHTYPFGDIPIYLFGDIHIYPWCTIILAVFIQRLQPYRSFISLTILLLLCLSGFLVARYWLVLIVIMVAFFIYSLSYYCAPFYIVDLHLFLCLPSRSILIIWFVQSVAATWWGHLLRERRWQRCRVSCIIVTIVIDIQ